MQKRSALKDICPGLWDSSVSGHLDSGESYEAAAVRELGEEMGIIVDEPPQEIARITPREETGWDHVRLYKTTFNGKPRYPAAEVEAAMWFPLDEIAAWIKAAPEDFAPGFLQCWQSFNSI